MTTGAAYGTADFLWWSSSQEGLGVLDLLGHSLDSLSTRRDVIIYASR